jgi:squalene-hopene/tetraprenyl-beta-curcumene cyclase
MANTILTSETLHSARRRAVDRLLAARHPLDHWRGRLTSSALSTATAITALRLADQEATNAGRPPAHANHIAAGARWLRDTQQADGSWGDTVDSCGNLSTTLLAWAALGPLTPEQGGAADCLRRADSWIVARTGSLEAAAIARSLAAIYGRDQTFAVPILTHVALCDRFGDHRHAASWRHVPQLPCELAALPQRWFRFVDMQVVSYALPALIAIGQVRHARRPTAGPGAWLRSLTRGRVLSTLREIQPASGGYLEATPLTSFVTMSLVALGEPEHPVTRAAVGFLLASQRDDGSWPIDTDLATWNTTLAVKALAAGGRLAAYLDTDGRDAVRSWLLAQQWRAVHPYTGAAPGGWAWTDLPGGVPDADDTSGSVLALEALAAAEHRPTGGDVQAATTAGVRWLAGLANRDGGIPTFCRGWGRLPFDTSCPDITAHFLAAAATVIGSSTAAQDRLAASDRRLLERAVARARAYLAATQAADGSWRPLWFGNQLHPELANPTYGTAKVVQSTLDPRGTDWLMAAMATDGGVGPGPGLTASIEETAVTVDALATVVALTKDPALATRARTAVERGVQWLLDRTDEAATFPTAPIGLYFAKLWYAEDLYPLVFTVGAWERAAGLVSPAG